MAYDLLEPFGQDRSDDGARMIAAMIYNMGRGPKTKPVMPDELMKPWRPKEQVDAATAAAQAAAWFEARAVEAD